MKIYILVIAVLIACVFIFDLNHYLDFAFIKSQQQALTDYYQANPLQSIVIFFVIYVLATSFSIPGASILSLLAGAIFGLVIGSALVLISTVSKEIYWLSRNSI